MTEDEKEKFIEGMKKYSKRISSSATEAKKLLFKTGMYNKNGSLKSSFKTEKREEPNSPTCPVCFFEQALSSLETVGHIVKRFREDYDKDKRAIERLVHRLSDIEDFMICPDEKFYNHESCDKITCEDCWKEWAYKEEEDEIFYKNNYMGRR